MKKHTVEITIPVYNEEKELEKHITILYNFCKKNLTQYTWHITIADNASKDATSPIAKNIVKKFPEVSLFTLKQKGRGRAVKESWKKSNADYCVYMDLDLSTDLIHLPNIIKALEQGSDIAIGRTATTASRSIFFALPDSVDG